MNIEIMRVGIFPKTESDLELYHSRILTDSYVLYNPKKVRNGEVQDGKYLSGRFERIKVKRNKRVLDFNLN